MARTVFIVHPGSLGDVLLAVPALRRLRTKYPHHELVLSARGHAGSVLMECGLVHAWCPLDGSACAELFSGSPVVTGQLADWLKRCDVAVAWTQDDRGVLRDTLRSSGVKEAVVGSPFSSTVKTVHQSDRFLETINESPERSEERTPVMVPDRWRAEGRSLLAYHGIEEKQRLIVVHPGSGSLHKCVAPDALASLIELMGAKGKIPVIVEGPADAESVARLHRKLSNPVTVMRGKDLQTAIGLLSYAECFVGQDSGVTHLAALFGISTLALFGPTDSARWAPRGKHVTVLRGNPCSCRSWEAVRQCDDKPCLKFSAHGLLEHCLSPATDDKTPQVPPDRALSLPTPCARVAS